MKTKILRTISVIIFVVTVLLNYSCSQSNNSVEYWKPTVFEKFAYSKACDVIDDYLDERFSSLVKTPNEYQSAYLEIAKEFCKRKLDLRGEENLPEKIQNYISSVTIEDEIVMANLKSHPDLYVENVLKIIGSVDDLRKALAEHVKVDKIVNEKVSGYKRHNVLYNIANEAYAIYCITEKDKMHSEIQFIENSNSISDILDYWQMYESLK